jgi:hypothetical protein
MKYNLIIIDRMIIRRKLVIKQPFIAGDFPSKAVDAF